MIKFLFVLLLFYNSLFAIFETKTVDIISTTNKTATIDQGNLSIGQTGIIVHKYKNNNSIILCDAKVIASNNNSSKIEFIKLKDSKQYTYATTNLKPQNQDKFILNHLYKNVLIIAPNLKTYNTIKAKFKKQVFLSSDIFASILKANNNPTPTKKDFQDFCRFNFIGLLFVYIKDRLYIVDTKSFKTIKQIKIAIDAKEKQKPFYSLVENIEKNPLKLFGQSGIGKYDEYYTKLLGISNVR